VPRGSLGEVDVLWTCQWHVRPAERAGKEGLPGPACLAGTLGREVGLFQANPGFSGLFETIRLISRPPNTPKPFTFLQISVKYPALYRRADPLKGRPSFFIEDWFTW